MTPMVGPARPSLRSCWTTDGGREGHGRHWNGRADVGCRSGLNAETHKHTSLEPEEHLLS